MESQSHVELEKYSKSNIKAEEDDSSSDDTEEEVEPMLRYERLANDVPKILQDDAASCVCVHTKFLALGTHLGVIHILDHQGNNIKELILHDTTVNQISIDGKGDYFASCSNDGKVVVRGMYSSDLNTSVTVERPVRAICLDPNFSRSSACRRFIIGEDKVVLYERYVLARYKATVLYQGEGPIRNIQWKDRFVVWASDKTVRLFDLEGNKIVTVMQRDYDSKLRPEMFRCNLFWKDNKTLLIGWANSVKVCSVVASEQPPLAISSKDPSAPSRYYVKITSMFNTDFFVSGISSLDDTVVLLTINNPSSFCIDGKSRPQLRVIEPHGEDFHPISSDTLSLRGYQECSSNDYYLDSLSEEGLYFIVTLKDFVVAKPRDEDDHVAWLLEHEKYEEAVNAVKESKNIKKHSLLGVGQLYLDHLLQMKNYNVAAELCSTILGLNKQLWEEEVFKFAQIRQLRTVAPFLPIEDPLDPAIYEMVLNEYLQCDQKEFLHLIRKWPCHLYNIPTVISAIMEQLACNPCLELHESLSELYINDKKYDKALTVLIEVGNKDRVFELIKNHNLFASISDRLEILIELNSAVATSMLLDNMDKVPIDLVVSKLKHKPKLLYEYLSKVFQRDPSMGEEHHGILVELYAEYAPEKLLFFLRHSNNYPLEHALDVCQQRSLIHEVVFLLGRMGNTKQALQQITQQLQDINQAIEFCKDHDDKELWDDLIEYSLDKPGFITVLLQNIGTHVDPIILIRRIPDGMEIPGLRDSLVKILQDYNLQISLREGCKKILVSDWFSLLEKLNKLQRRGILISEDQECQSCYRKLLVNDARCASDILVLNCRHGFHESCLPVQGLETCIICSAQKQVSGVRHMVN